MAAEQSGPAKVRIDKTISTFSPSKRFRPDEPDTSILSIDFDDTGELAVVARNDDTLQIYNCQEGKQVKELKSQKYGVHLARYTHHSESILYASTRIDDQIRYLSSHDNSYIRYFEGHEAPVTSIEVSPSNDTFISSSLDNTLRLWALNTKTAVGMLDLKGVQLCAFDPSATVIAAASPITQTVLLYDYRNYDKAPFATFDLQAMEHRFSPRSRYNGGSSPPEPWDNWTRLSFSNDGRSLLVTTAGSGHFVLDAFDGSLRAFLPKKGSESNRLTHSKTPTSAARAKMVSSGQRNPYKTPALGQGDACWSSDGRYVVGSLALDPTPPTQPLQTGQAGQSPFGTNGGLMVWDLYERKDGTAGPGAAQDENAAAAGADDEEEYQPELPADILNNASAGDAGGISISSSSSSNTGPGSGGLAEYEGFQVTKGGRALQALCELSGPGRSEVVGFNPRFNMIMSADKDLLMWLPDRDLL